MSSPSSERTRVRRLPQRGVYDRAAIRAILREGMVCQVGIAEGGQPFVVPMTYGLDGDLLYLHGSQGSRLLRHLAGGAPCCVSVTLLDGLVIARSAFHHSMNYRSVTILGRARALEDPARKEHALRCIVEHVVPGRHGDCRPPSPAEAAGTLVLELDVGECSAKVRQGPPLDDEEDYALPYWAGVLPLRTTYGPPQADARLPGDLPAPPYLAGYRRPSTAS